jgi:hypothetical protein
MISGRVPFAAIVTDTMCSPRPPQWTQRDNYDDYLAWRTEQGFTATFEGHADRAVRHYYDIPYFGEGIASTRTTQH